MAIGRKKIGFINMTVGLGLVGLVFGYLMFGRFLGEYLSLGQLLAPAGNLLEELGRQIAGIKTARQNLFGVGAVAGLVLSLLLKRRR